MAEPLVVLVPGAWMGGWIWDRTVQALRERGHDAHTLTLAGLSADASPQDAARPGLADHVDQVLAAVEGAAECVLVAHSYSGTVVGQVADRLGARVRRSVHLGSFLPEDGRALIDLWGPGARAEEAAAIERHGGLWAPPTPVELEGERDLSRAQRDYLLDRFRPHPGRTVLDPARMGAAVTAQPMTYVSLAPAGADPWAAAPAEVRSLPATARRSLASGHWPMLGRPEALVSLLEEEIRG